MARETQRVVRVVTDYVSAFPNPITVKAGERLTIEDRETEWSGWLWCTATSGASGWVPADYVRRSAHTGTARRDYDATELTVKKGERLTVIEEVASWYWCRSERGSLGWVPKQNVEIIQNQDQQHKK